MASMLQFFLLAGALAAAVLAAIIGGAPQPPPNTPAANAGVVAVASPPPNTTTATSVCPRATYPCGDGVDIQYPFWVDTNVSSCGYPSLRLECRGSMPVLPLPSGDYIIRKIIYGDAAHHTVSIVDLAVSKNMSCPIIAGRNLTLPAGSPPPFSLTELDANLTFYRNCNFSGSTSTRPIPCLESTDGGLQTYVFRDDDHNNLPQVFSMLCEDVVGMPVLGRSMSNFSGSIDEVMAALEKGFELRWSLAKRGECANCEKTGGFCGIERREEAGQAFKCFKDSAAPSGGRTFKPPAIAFFCFIGIIIGAALIALGAIKCGICGSQGTQAANGPGEIELT